MKRLLLPVAAAVLLSAAPADAATPQAGVFKAKKGQVQLGYDLKFTVKGNRITKVVANVLENCSGETTSSVTTIAPDSSWTIKGGKFSGRKKETVDQVTVYYTLEGKFTSATTAVGTIRQETIVAGATCDTKKLKFTARR